nr:type II secretion system protein [Bacillus sp. FJAT-45037]
MEVILSLALLSMCSLAILPAFITIYNERLTIKQEEEVNTLLKQSVQDYLRSAKVNTPVDSWMEKQEHLDPVTGLYEVCISFNGENTRFYQRCLYAKR